MRERPRLIAIVERILHDRNAAEDVAQEALASFARRYGADTPFASSWLRTAATHGAYDVLRRERRRLARERREHVLDRASRDDAAQAANPAAQIERVEERAAVRSALVRIGERHATVLALRYGGLSYAQVAETLGITIGSVGTRLARAESALGKELRK
ncbi:MAG: sigma-70 family RNA polymerase sigma factor [Candidatus Eremiobacteraeota bacterium]|nr:sigma-70 family RNA polymerase sigma factor [Candidatus Eremiobacteraeota bacterium]